MAGTIEGGKLAAQTNKQKYDESIQKEHGMSFYQYIGMLGGSTKPTKPRGFAAMSYEERRAAGKKGGLSGKRTKNEN